MSINMFTRLLLIFVGVLYTLIAQAQIDLHRYDVRWKDQSTNSWGSMPIGNGDVGSNVWVTKEGVLNLLISKTDAYSEIGRLLKIGKIEVRFTPNILDAKAFEQELDLQSGTLTIKANKEGKTLQLSCRVDANAPTIHIEGSSSIPIKAEVTNKIWRTSPRPLVGNERHSGYGVTFRDEPFMTEVDTVLQADNAMIWCHENKTSIWQMTLDNQNISAFNQQSSDPLIGQHFGAIVGGKGFTPSDSLTLLMKNASNNFSLHVVVDKSRPASIIAWKTKMKQKLNKSMGQDPVQAKTKHKAWWNAFWNRHYIIVDADDPKEKTFEITQSYLLQRYMNACSGRGSVPIKFNGSIFTVDVQEDLGPAKKGYDADYRSWGGNFWFQNTRLIYWTMYHSGDAELMKPFFDLYTNALPLAQYRTRKYFGHDGAYFTETMTPWGSYLIDNYGWDRKGKPDGVSDNLYIRYYWLCGLEMSTMMFEYLAYTKDTAYFTSKMAPFIKEIITFYDQHYKRDSLGKLLISPAQSLETFQEGMINPTPELAGLLFNMEKISAHASLFADPRFINACKKLKEAIPAIPIDLKNGNRTIAAGSKLGPRLNIENPELYTIFPFRLYGIDKPELDLAINTFDAREVKLSQGWHQDAIQAALLGKTREAKEMVTRNFLSKHEGSRFPAFWGPNYDWVPDQDHGSVTSRALQNMLIQTEGNKTMLFPAWPKEWNVQFKLHTSGQGVIEGKYTKGKGVKLTRRPKEMEIDVVMDTASQKDRPNVIFILADDLGHGDLSYLNPNAKTNTPNIDLLAKQGKTFTDAHAPASVCTPTRYGILTGRYGWRGSLKKGVSRQYDPPLIENRRYTVGKLFQENGYATACIGKWHLGWDWPLKNGGYMRDSLQADASAGERLRMEKQVDFLKRLENGPLTKGFDHYFGDDVPNYPPYCFIENDRTIGTPDRYKPDSLYGHPGLMTENWRLENVVPAITEKAVKYIGEKAAERKPFFLYFALTSPHVPIAPTDAFKGKSKAGAYGDFVEETDWAVGEVIKAVAKAGIEKNTIIIFTSDNGSPGQDGTAMSGAMNAVLKYGHDPNYPFRGMKTDLWEGGHHVPFIIRWLENIKPNTTSYATICHTDLIATCAGILNKQLPKGEAQDSYDLTPLLTEKSNTTYQRPYTIHHSSEGFFAIRKGEWKLIMTGNSGGGLIPSKPELINGMEAPIQLYDISKDPGEKRNLYQQFPEKVNELKKLLMEAQQG